MATLHFLFFSGMRDQESTTLLSEAHLEVVVVLVTAKHPEMKTTTTKRRRQIKKLFRGIIPLKHAYHHPSNRKISSVNNTHPTNTPYIGFYGEIPMQNASILFFSASKKSLFFSLQNLFFCSLLPKMSAVISADNIVFVNNRRTSLPIFNVG